MRGSPLPIQDPECYRCAPMVRVLAVVYFVSLAMLACAQHHQQKQSLLPKSPEKASIMKMIQDLETVEKASVAPVIINEQDKGI